MKTINLTLFSFDELSENVQKKIIERERWNVMERCMDCYASEYKASLKSFEKLTDASIVAYEYKLLYHEKFFEHLHMERLVIDENIPFPVSTWERSYRYKGYGYNMCRETKKKLLQAIKGVNVEEEDVSLYTTGGWD